MSSGFDLPSRRPSAPVGFDYALSPKIVAVNNVNCR